MQQFTYNDLARLSNQLELLLYRYKARATVVSGKVLPNFIELLLVPVQGTRMSQIKTLQPDIALGLGCADVRIAQKNQFVAVQLTMKTNLGASSLTRSPVLLSKLIERLKGQSLQEFTCVLGLCEDGMPLMAQLTSPIVSHILVAGATGSGKTTLAQTIVMSLCIQCRPRQFGLIVIDPKQRANDAFARSVSDHLLLPVARTVEEATRALERVEDVMLQRVIDEAIQPRLLVYVDEVADLCLSGGKRVMEILTRVAQRGREAGVHLLACTQKPSAKVLGSLLKSNLPLRLVGRVASADDARVAAGMPRTGAERLNGNGDFLAITGADVIRFQAALPR